MDFQNSTPSLARNFDVSGGNVLTERFVHRQIVQCGKDVASALGYSNPRDALSRHCRGVLKRNAPTDGGTQEMSFIPEGDVYRLITHSKRPTAEKFEKWVIFRCRAV